MSQFAIAAAVVAHEGGWDEILLVGGPIVLIVGLLALAKRRVDAHGHHDAPGAGDESDVDAGGLTG